jgi:hypothetical protein
VTHTYTGKVVTQCLDPLNARLARQMSGETVPSLAPTATQGCPAGFVPGFNYSSGQPKWGCVVQRALTPPLTARPKTTAELPCPPGKVHAPGMPGCVSVADAALLVKRAGSIQTKACSPGWVWWPGSADRVPGCMSQKDFDKRQTTLISAAKKAACLAGQIPYRRPGKTNAFLCRPGCPGEVPPYAEGIGDGNSPSSVSIPYFNEDGYFEACAPTTRTQVAAQTRYDTDAAEDARILKQKQDYDTAYALEQKRLKEEADALTLKNQIEGGIAICVDNARKDAASRYGPLAQFMVTEEEIQATCKAPAALAGFAGFGEVGSDQVWLKVTPRVTSLGAYRGFFAVFGPTYDSLVGVTFGG